MVCGGVDPNRRAVNKPVVKRVPVVLVSADHIRIDIPGCRGAIDPDALPTRRGRSGGDTFPIGPLRRSGDVEKGIAHPIVVAVENITGVAG